MEVGSGYGVSKRTRVPFLLEVITRQLAFFKSWVASKIIRNNYAIKSLNLKLLFEQIEQCQVSSCVGYTLAHPNIYFAMSERENFRA